MLIFYVWIFHISTYSSQFGFASKTFPLHSIFEWICSIILPHFLSHPFLSPFYMNVYVYGSPNLLFFCSFNLSVHKWIVFFFWQSEFAMFGMEMKTTRSEWDFSGKESPISIRIWCKTMFTQKDNGFYQMFLISIATLLREALIHEHVRRTPWKLNKAPLRRKWMALIYNSPSERKELNPFLSSKESFSSPLCLPFPAYLFYLFSLLFSVDGAFFVFSASPYHILYPFVSIPSIYHTNPFLFSVEKRIKVFFALGFCWLLSMEIGEGNHCVCVFN